MNCIRKTKLILIVLLTAIFSVSTLFAEPDKHHDHEQRSHVHGQAKLNLVLEGGILNIQFISPAVNIVGFEHEHPSDDEKKQISQAIDVLEKANNLYTFIGGGCRAVTNQVTSTFADDHHSEHHNTHDDHHHEHQGASEHQEFTAEYGFKCDKPGQLSGIKFKLLSLFQGIQKMEVHWVVRNKQGADVLTSKNATLRFDS